MSEQADRDALAELLAGHETVASGLGEWCCKCDPTTWRPSAQRARHLADAASDLLAQRDRRVAAKAIREAAEEFATGAWNDAWTIAQVDDDVSAVRATEAWFNKQADRIEVGE